MFKRFEYDLNLLHLLYQLFEQTMFIYYLLIFYVVKYLLLYSTDFAATCII